MKITSIMTLGEWRSLSDESRRVINIVTQDYEQSTIRLKLSRELIAALTNNGQLSPRLMTPETKTLWERWQAEEGKP